MSFVLHVEALIPASFIASGPEALQWNQQEAVVSQYGPVGLLLFTFSSSLILGLTQKQVLVCLNTQPAFGILCPIDALHVPQEGLLPKT